MNYRKKEVIIQAVKWMGDNLEEILFLDHPEVKRMSTTPAVDGGTTLRVRTIGGSIIVAVIGDFIVKGTMGELYILNTESFKRDYETI